MDTVARVHLPRRGSVRNTATVVAVALSLLAVLYLLLVPVYSGHMLYEDSAGLSGSATTRSTLIEGNGWRVLVPVLVPVAICVAAWAARHTRAARGAGIGAALLLWAFVVVAGFSIGLFYLPSALAMTVAARAAA